MDLATVPGLEPMRLGTIIDRSFRLLRVVVPAALPLLLLVTILGTLQQVTLQKTDLIWQGPVILIYTAASVLFYFCAIFLAASAWHGQVLTFNQAMARLRWRHLWRTFLVWLLIIVFSLLLALLLILPGLIYFVNRVLAMYIVVLEDAPVGTALYRSKQLMTSAPWYSFSGPWCRYGALALFLFMIGVCFAILGMMLAVPLWSGSTIENLGGLVLTALSILLPLLFQLLGYLATTGFYYDLRSRHEGADLLAELSGA